MNIPVEVQEPNKPHTARVLGEAPDDLTAEEVAERVGVPDGCLVDGRIIRRGGAARWSLVAWVKITEVVQREGVCPRCGKSLT